MRFYKENHINPAASCLPLVAQFPVFISLYLVLKHFSNHIPPGSDLVVAAHRPEHHRQGELALVRATCCSPIYAGSQVLSTYFMSATMEKSQRDLMMVLPLIFISVIAHFPIGPRHLLGDDEPVDGRPGHRHPPARAANAARPADARRPEDGRRGRRRRRRSGAPRKGDAGNGARTEPPAPKPRPPAQTQPRRVKRKKGGARR